MTSRTFFFSADVARIDAQAVHAVFGHFQRNLVIKMDVRDQRKSRLGADSFKGLRRLHTEHRDPDQGQHRRLRSIEFARPWPQRHRFRYWSCSALRSARHRQSTTLPTRICLLLRRLIGEGWFMATVLPCAASSRALVIDSDAPATLCIRLNPDTDYAMPTHNYLAHPGRLLDRRFAGQVAAPRRLLWRDRPVGSMIPLGFVSITRFRVEKTHLKKRNRIAPIHRQSPENAASAP